jgi:hypothetical protein
MKFSTMGYLATFFFAVFFAVGCKKEAVVDSVANTSTTSNTISLPNANNRLSMNCSLNTTGSIEQILSGMNRVINCNAPACMGSSNTITKQSSCLSQYFFKNVCYTPPSVDQMNQMISEARSFAIANAPADPCYSTINYEFVKVFSQGPFCIQVIVTYSCCTGPLIDQP